ncbi:MAG TPA: LLM class flavin-dependent oxidoreductase [Acidimicrobiia bacterium]|nr:LLM class flavin-dependent oxidoreductase [Acidimicrobiia bacterium]
MAKLAITLPSFRESPDPAIEVARAAEAAGLDAAFVFDHLFRARGEARRPAIEGFTLLGALAVETTRIALGPFVARATLHPPATLAHTLDTVQRVSNGRLIAGLGAGDHESAAENETFGLEFGSMADRVRALADAITATSGRGYPVWVGGTSAAVRTVAAGSEGWNRWGGPVERFARQATGVRAQAARPITVSWGGLVVVGEDDAAAARKADRLQPSADTIVGGPERVAEQFRAYVDAGAEWIVAGPVDSGDPENATILGERVAALLR